MNVFSLCKSARVCMHECVHACDILKFVCMGGGGGGGGAYACYSLKWLCPWQWQHP